MQKEDIIRRLNEIDFDKTQYWLITGSAMVLYGIRSDTHDIDLGCTTKMADELEQKGYIPILSDDGKRKFIIDEDIEIFEEWLCDTTIMYESIPVISLKGLVEMKTILGRDKDFRDIKLIEAFMQDN